MTTTIAENVTTAVDFDSDALIVEDFSGWTTVSSHRTSEGMVYYMRNVLGEFQIVVKPR